MAEITGRALIAWGFKPGKWFPQALETANTMRANGADDDAIFAAVQQLAPVEIAVRTNALPFSAFIEAETEDERTNVEAVTRDMDALMRTPTIKAGAIMPDACPAGTIPVGGVVATENAIHPGFHSADVCCSMAMTVFKRGDDPARVLDTIQKAVHFGPQKREKRPAKPPAEVMQAVSENRFLKGLEDVARWHFTTQGDGNHFYYVGHLESTGQLAVVSHHGSRGLGAQLYKRGMAAARKLTKIVAPKVHQGAAWIAADSDEGRDYWDALQIVRLWTKANHYAVHDLVASALGNKIEDRLWNEHNFVFRKDDGLYYHAKGATPSYAGFSPDDDGRTLIPMNMAEPILIAAHGKNRDALEFAPHGAGRNMSRTRFLREHRPEMPKDIDVRFFCGIADKSELPDAYKNAAQVTAQIDKHGLANVSDRVMPYGSIMAGDWERDAPWKVKARKKHAAAGEGRKER